MTEEEDCEEALRRSREVQETGGVDLDLRGSELLDDLDSKFVEELDFFDRIDPAAAKADRWLEAAWA